MKGILLTISIVLGFNSTSQAIDFDTEFYGFSVSAIESSNSNYEHDTFSLRAHFTSQGWEAKGWELRWSIEPNIHWYEHELNNPLYIKEDETNYLELRTRYTEGLDFMHVGVEGAILARKRVTANGHLELSAGLGAGYLEDETERQAKGFTFSQTGRIGYSLDTSHGEFFVGYTIMHVSNAGLENPNGGYDLSGITIRFQKKLASLP